MAAVLKRQRTKKQHYLPATFLANFSTQSGRSRRKRRIVAGDKRNRRCFRATVEKVAVEKEFYSLGKGADSEIIEKIWAGYESRLAGAIDVIIANRIDALTWAGILVPFVSSLLVRGPDFRERFERRLAPLLSRDVNLEPGNTNFARMFELQRLLAPILAARWIVAEAEGAGSLITNDMGYAGFRAPQTGELGLVVPLTQRHVLQIIPCRKRQVAVARGSTWIPVIEYRRLSPGNHIELNPVIAEWARRFIFGPDEGTVCPHVTHADVNDSPIPDPGAFGFIGGHLLRVHEFTWHWLMSAIAKSPETRPTWGSSIDWKAIAAVWKPMVVFPANPNQTRFPAGLIRDGDTIIVDLYDVDEDAQLVSRL